MRTQSLPEFWNKFDGGQRALRKKRGFINGWAGESVVGLGLLADKISEPIKPISNIQGKLKYEMVTLGMEQDFISCGVVFRFNFFSEKLNRVQNNVTNLQQYIIN
ncbi:hypothetical protein [Helicobacter sp. 11S02596-1]|uniref:hypothetical protein n=1 Tax=Helicobacter sp. 11S02596-1 TaxID=1476194 RepID=UPI000BA70021|nr:hypothetical protein [Helicobacter sp. 11S02596-1]PAF43582.1 hypothetical protein BJI48_04825 [Helicobacter sp. 11S02596-1]